MGVYVITLVNIKALQVIQPEGPYRLLGYSYGGVVAYEMARILLQQGQEVSSLVLLDSFAPWFVQQQKSLDDKERLLEVTATLATLYGRNLTLDIQGLQQVPDDHQVEEMSRLLKREGVDITSEQFATFYRVFKANRHCYLNYQAEKMPHELDVRLYRANEREPDSEARLADHGWNALLLNPVQVHDVQGNHFSILSREGVQQIVDLMKGI